MLVRGRAEVLIPGAGRGRLPQLLPVPGSPVCDIPHCFLWDLSFLGELLMRSMSQLFLAPSSCTLLSVAVPSFG